MSLPIKAASADCTDDPFYLIQTNGHDKRYVVSLRDKEKLKLFFAGFINQATDDELQVRILKQEKIGSLKMNMLQGNLYLTPKRLVLDAHKTGVGGFGLLGSILKKKVEEKSFGFNLELNRIKSISQGKHGVQNNVLEITNSNDETFRILVKEYNEWEAELKS